MEKRFWVYIITDKAYGTLYTGMTSDLTRRIYEHQRGLYEGFSKKHNLKMLVYYEEHQCAETAIHREKNIKEWKREWKIELIHKLNRQWHDLAQDLNK